MWNLLTLISQVQRAEPYKNAYRATDRVTSLGVLWENNCRTPIQWAPEARSVFKDLLLPLPEGLVAEQSVAGAGEEELLGNSVQSEPSDTAAAVAAAEATAADADAANARAEAAPGKLEATADAVAGAADAAASILSREAGDAAGDSQEARNTASLDQVDRKAVNSPEARGDTSVVAPSSDTKADATEERPKEPKKLTTVDTATAPEQTVSRPKRSVGLFTYAFLSYQQLWLRVHG